MRFLCSIELKLKLLIFYFHAFSFCFTLQSIMMSHICQKARKSAIFWCIKLLYSLYINQDMTVLVRPVTIMCSPPLSNLKKELSRPVEFKVREPLSWVVGSPGEGGGGGRHLYSGIKDVRVSGQRTMTTHSHARGSGGIMRAALFEYIYKLQVYDVLVRSYHNLGTSRLYVLSPDHRTRRQTDACK